jgi:hypothetical protein
MDYSIKEDKQSLMVTKKVYRVLAPFFAFVGIVTISLFFFGYYSLFNDIDSVNFFGFTVFTSFLTNFIDLYLAISGGFILGTIYFCCWSEGWEITKSTPELIPKLNFFWKLGFFKKIKTYSNTEIETIYVKKIPLDELKLYFMYQLIVVIKKNDEKDKTEKILLIDSDTNYIHSLGLKSLANLLIEEKLNYISK